MSMSLHPFAARIHMSTSRSTETPWSELLGTLFSTIAKESQQTGGPMIGHVKGIARAGDAFMRINCVSERRPPDVEGHLPSDVHEVDLDLAMLVFGLGPETAHAIVETALRQCGLRWPMTCFLDIARRRHDAVLRH